MVVKQTNRMVCMKRFLIIITACFVLNISFNQVLSAPQSDKTFILCSDKALPSIQVSEQKIFSM